MATKTADLHIRIQPDLKAKAETIFARTGHTMSDAIEQLLTWTVLHQKSPIRLRKRRANIPDLNLMTEEDVRKMLEEAEENIAKAQKTGEGLLTADEFKAQIKEEFNIDL